MGAWDGLHELHGALGWHGSEKVASVGLARLAPWACCAAGIGGMRGIIGLCVRHAWRTMHVRACVCANFCFQEVVCVFVTWSQKSLVIVVLVLIESHFAGSPLSLERGLRHGGSFIAIRVFCPVFGYMICMSEHAGMRFYLDTSVVCIIICTCAEVRVFHLYCCKPCPPGM